MNDTRALLSVDPLNAEAPLQALTGGQTPLDLFYVRCNFATPDLEARAWKLDVGGALSQPMRLGLDDVMARPAVTRRVTLECAGNGRTSLDPPVPGTPWTLGAAGTATFTGTPLAPLLAEVGLAPDVVEIRFSGADSGERDGWGTVAFERSLPVADALREPDGPLLAWQMNGEPLRPEHGAPVRLVVPGWYAVASVKWLVEIRALTRPFVGHFQTDRYLYRVPDEPPTPVTRMRVRALLLDPDPEAQATDGAVRVAAGARRLTGVAWSGEAPVTGVRVSCDAGATWQEAIVAQGPRNSAVPWHLETRLGPGRHEVVVRARDASGAEQPLAPVWNELGYGNNAAQRIVVEAVQPSPSS